MENKIPILLIKQREDLNTWTIMMDFLWFNNRDLWEYLSNHLYQVDSESLNNLKLEKIDR